MASGLTYDLSFFWGGQPSIGQLAGFTATRPLSIAANMAGSVGSAQNLPLGTVNFILNRNGVQVGNLQITSGGVFTFTTTGGAALGIAIDDELVWSAPSPQDGRLSDVSIVIEAFESDAQPGGWITGFDINFAALPNQALGVDGAYIVDGVGAYKYNSANEVAGMAIVAGQGLVIQPAINTNFDATHRSAPLLSLNLSTVISVINWGMPLQWFVQLVAQDFTYAGDQFVAALEESIAPNTYQALGMAFDGAPSLAWFATAATNGISQGGAQSPVASKAVGMMELPAGPQVPVNLYDGNYPGGWPGGNQELQLEASASQFGVAGFSQSGGGVIQAPENWILSLGAYRTSGTSAPALSVTIGRIACRYQAR